MKNFTLCGALGIAGVVLLANSSRAQEKLAQSGLEFLSVVSDARAAALGQAVTSLELRSAALFFNPAGMTNTTSFLDASASHNTWIADIKHNTISLAVNPENGDYGVFGVSLQFVDYGEIQGTVVSTSEKGYEDIGNISASGFAVGFGYAKALSEQFSVGGQVRWVRQSLGESIIPLTDSTTTTAENEVSPFAFDFGTRFHTGIKSLTFAMSIRNLSREVKYQQEGFQLPLLFSLGVSMDVMDLVKENPDMNLLVTVDAIHPRAHIEQLLMGVEWTFLEAFSLRGGFVSGEDEAAFRFGFGVSKFGLQFDYAYTPYGVFDNVQQFTFRFFY